MGIIGKIFSRPKREEKLVVPPEQMPGKMTPKQVAYRPNAPRTRRQIVGRRKAMVGRKANVQRLVKTRKP